MASAIPSSLRSLGCRFTQRGSFGYDVYSVVYKHNAQPQRPKRQSVRSEYLRIEP